MTPLHINEKEFKLLRDFIEDECGLLLGDEKAYLIENRLSKMAIDLGCRSFGEFYQRLRQTSRADKLRARVIDAITTHETFWFRDQFPFKVLEDRILSEYQELILDKKQNTVKIWSAACATGQEPYSIAMTALDFYHNSGYKADVCQNQVRILATDISADTLSEARVGRYDNNAMIRGLPDDCLKRYFRKEKNEWVIVPEVRNMVTFRDINLKEPMAGIIGPFDIIFLRNVIIYFSETFKKTLLSRVATLLNPGGYMFLGAGETVGGYSEAYDMLEYEGAIFYRLKGKG